MKLRGLVIVSGLFVALAVIAGLRYQNRIVPLTEVYTPTIPVVEIASAGESLRALDARLREDADLSIIRQALPDQAGVLWIALLVFLVVGVRLCAALECAQHRPADRAGHRLVSDRIARPSRDGQPARRPYLLWLDQARVYGRDGLVGDTRGSYGLAVDPARHLDVDVRNRCSHPGGAGRLHRIARARLSLPSPD